MTDTRITDALRGLVPTSTPPTFPTPDVGYAVHDTRIGRLLLARRSDGRFVACRFVGSVADEDATLTAIAGQVSPRVLRAPQDVDEARRRIDAYLAGQRQDLGLPVDLALASDFAGDVLTAVARRVGFGERAAYAQVAGWIGQPRAARAVGAALGSNPVCLLVPCHRIVGASGALTGYAGGLAAKEYLLALESRDG